MDAHVTREDGHQEEAEESADDALVPASINNKESGARVAVTGTVAIADEDLGDGVSAVAPPAGPTGGRCP